MNYFRFSAKLWIFLAIYNFGAAEAAVVPQESKPLGPSPFVFAGTYDNATFYRADLLTCMTPSFTNNLIDSLNRRNRTANLAFTATSSKSSKESTRTTTVTTSVLWGLFSETTSYTTSTKTDNYSLAVGYKSNYMATVNIDEFIPSVKAGLNPDARRLYDSIDTAIANNDQNLASANYKKFRQMCGTGIITQMDGGVDFEFTLLFNFKSVIEKDGAVSAAGIKTFADALKLVKNNGRNSYGAKIDFSLNIIAMQLGGDVEQLANLLSQYAPKAKTTDSSSLLMSTLKTDSGSLRRDGNTFSLSCKIDPLATTTNKCAELIDALTNYGGRIESQLTNNNLYYTNPVEKLYHKEITGADFTKNANVNKEEQNKLWAQYSKDEKSYKYVTRYINYLQNIESRNVIGNLTQITDLEKSNNKQALSALISSLEKIKAEYTNVMVMYDMPDVKKSIKNCFTNVNVSCSESSASVFNLRRTKFTNESQTDNLVHYLMNSEYISDVYVGPREYLRCYIMPISEVKQGFYLADCQDYGNEKPKFVMQIIHGNNSLDIHSFSYAIGKNIFTYYDYRESSGASAHDVPDAPDIQSGDVFSHPVANVARHTYPGNMMAVISPKEIPAYTSKPKTSEDWQKEVTAGPGGYDPNAAAMPSYVTYKRMPFNLEQLVE